MKISSLVLWSRVRCERGFGFPQKHPVDAFVVPNEFGVIRALGFQVAARSLSRCFGRKDNGGFDRMVGEDAPGDAKVLEHEIHGESRVELSGEDMAGVFDLGCLAASGGTIDDFDHVFGLDAYCRGGAKDFCRSGQVGRRKQIVQRLGGMTGPCLSHVHDVGTHGLQMR